jgi:myo-inositol-hexaphosphate 3-phosphohydrolase
VPYLSKMTRGQKIAIIISSVAVSVVVGGLLYLYFNRQSVLKKLQDGDSVTYKMKEPKADHHKSNEYDLVLKTDARSEDGYAIILKQDGEMRGQYWMINDVPNYVTDKEKTKTPIEDSKEAKFVKYLLSNA